MATTGSDKEYLAALKAALKQGPLKLAAVRGGKEKGGRVAWVGQGETRQAACCPACCRVTTPPARLPAQASHSPPCTLPSPPCS